MDDVAEKSEKNEKNEKKKAGESCVVTGSEPTQSSASALG